MCGTDPQRARETHKRAISPAGLANNMFYRAQLQTVDELMERQLVTGRGVG
jgi:hypothetical protein